MTTPFDYTPTLMDGHVILRPLVAEDFEALHAVASDPLIWAQHTATDRHEREVFRRFFDGAVRGTGGLAIVDVASGELIGSSRFHGYDPAVSEVEIGWTFLARSHWGGDTNGRSKRLMLDHAFGWVERVVLLAAPTNLRSRRAIAKIGGVERGMRPNARGEPSVEYVVERPR